VLTPEMEVRVLRSVEEGPGTSARRTAALEVSMLPLSGEFSVNSHIQQAVLTKGGVLPVASRRVCRSQRSADGDAGCTRGRIVTFHSTVSERVDIPIPLLLDATDIDFP
jgi:hypothetical protein